ncbi:diguanylate cyclase domain-containing protein [Mycobacterium sp. SMC-4]|uniref:GGDEF domain-containing protein n=1 Tax=Mycobacterium sp. SMC-4 TaxID=2857059 RepID=UPI003D09487A
MSGAQPLQGAGVARLLQAVQELSLVRSLPEIQRIVRVSARQLVGCDGATFVLRDREQCYYADEDAIAPLWKGNRFPMKACISGWTMLHRQAVVIPDIYVDARIPHEAYRPTFVKSLVMVPIRRLDPVGAIGAYWADQRMPTDDEVALLQALADSTSVAMENVALDAELEQRVADRTAALELVTEEIRRLSLTDELTGLSNRRGFFDRAEPELRDSCDAGGRCLLAFLDIDNLKWVNDTHGHDAGDRVLSDVATVLRTALDPAALCARLSGDEFCVLVTDSVQEPHELKDHIVAAVQQFNDAHTPPNRLSVSVGVIAVSAADAGTLDELLSRADELMYADKKSKTATQVAAVRV